MVQHKKTLLARVENGSSTSVRHVKEEIERQFKFKANDSSLIFSGQSLDNRRSLANYNLEDGDILTLVTKSKVIQITVKHQGRPFIVETDENETIGDLKKNCSEKVNQRPECLRLVGRGMTLFDDEPLRSLPNTALHLFVVEHRRQLQVVGLNGSSYPNDYRGDTQISEVKDHLIDNCNNSFCPRSADLFCLTLRGESLIDSRVVYNLDEGSELAVNHQIELIISDQDKTFQVTTPASNSVDQLKTQISMLKSYPKEQQRLTYGKKVLQNFNTLHGIPSGTTLRLNIGSAAFLLIISREDLSTLQIEGREEDSTMNLKGQIKFIVSISYDSMTLLYKGVELADLGPISAYGIRGQCTLQLVELTSWVQLTYLGEDYWLGYELTDTVADFKSRVEYNLKVLVSCQQLSHRGVQVEFGTLESLGIERGSTLCLEEKAS
jgi:hypothetical protein